MVGLAREELESERGIAPLTLFLGAVHIGRELQATFGKQQWSVVSEWRDWEAPRAGTWGTGGEGAHKGRPYRGRRGAARLRGDDRGRANWGEVQATTGIVR